MAKAAWNRTIVDASGNVLPGADITVTDERTGTLATLFDDREGNDAKSNPFVADTNGFARFFADAGVYRVVAESGALSRTWRFQSLLDNGVPITWTEDQVFTGNNTFSGDNTLTGNNTFSGATTLSGGVDASGGTTTLSTVAGDADFTGDIEFSGSTSGPGAMVNGKFVGEVFSIPGNHIASSADFAAVSLTDFLETKAIDEANYPNLVPFLRAQKLIYLEELTGEASTFAGTAAASVVTLTAPNDANEALTAGFGEWFLAMGSYPAVVIGGVTYEVTNVDTDSYEFTLGEAPPAGATTLEVYPHRIASSTTTARLWSWVGKTAIGAGTTETLAMMMRRDQMQRITGTITRDRFGGAAGTLSGAFSNGAIFGAAASAAAGAALPRIEFDSGSSPDARTSPTTDSPGATHSPDVAVMWYMWAGTYSA